MACSGDDAAGTSASTAPATVAPSGPVAATELVAGDCVAGLVVGADERARIESADVVSCAGTHDLEVFATFELAPADFEVEAGGYPGQQRIVDAADDGCNDRFESLGDAAESVGLLAVWPTAQSWTEGDRRVACAVYPESGRPFEGRGRIADD